MNSEQAIKIEKQKGFVQIQKFIPVFCHTVAFHFISFIFYSLNLVQFSWMIQLKIYLSIVWLCNFFSILFNYYFPYLNLWKEKDSKLQINHLTQLFSPHFRNKFYEINLNTKTLKYRHSRYRLQRSFDVRN